MSTPPIVPGPQDPYQQQPQQPAYVVKPPTPPGPSTIVGKTAISTITVIAILVGLFCVLPGLICGFLAIAGGGLNPPN